eukprot:COSAG02_NODE_1243_length_13681_cov_55.123767_5_plen_40_part_00
MPYINWSKLLAGTCRALQLVDLVQTLVNILFAKVFEYLY